MRVIPGMRERIPEDVADNRGDNDDRHRSRETEGLYYNRITDHVRPEAEVDESLSPS